MKWILLVLLAAGMLVAQPAGPPARDPLRLYSGPGWPGALRFRPGDFLKTPPPRGIDPERHPCSIRLIEVPIRTRSRMPVVEPKDPPFMPMTQGPAPPCPPGR
jgi:hypothetical protein